ncbi:hypothetical protein HMPREF3191_00125 [Veillonellaceae bacterium DNF00626]|nr:hypothetical protein HMPREF3191_00125 [Veillonellaceae bacterium DNF00626]
MPAIVKIFIFSTNYRLSHFLLYYYIKGDNYLRSFPSFFAMKYASRTFPLSFSKKYQNIPDICFPYQFMNYFLWHPIKISLKTKFLRTQQK